MKSSTRTAASGAANQVKGKVREAAGKVTGNRSQQVKGKVQAAVGKVQTKAAKAERETGD